MLNAFHVSAIPYLLERLKQSVDVDGSLLDNTLLMYGSSMGDSNLHNQRRVPFFLCGHAAGDVRQFGDSDGIFSPNP